MVVGKIMGDEFAMQVAAEPSQHVVTLWDCNTDAEAIVVAISSMPSGKQMFVCFLSKPRVQCSQIV
jgi:hypothetical protein